MGEFRFPTDEQIEQLGQPGVDNTLRWMLKSQLGAVHLKRDQSVQRFKHE